MLSSGSSTIPADYTLAPLTVEQYQAMARAGILEEGAPIELLEGYLVEKMTKRPPHSVATQLPQDALKHVLPVGWRGEEYADSVGPARNPLYTSTHGGRVWRTSPTRGR